VCETLIDQVLRNVVRTLEFMARRHESVIAYKLAMRN
jgi:hypothetical protein